MSDVPGDILKMCAGPHKGEHMTELDAAVILCGTILNVLIWASNAQRWWFS